MLQEHNTGEDRLFNYAKKIFKRYPKKQHAAKKTKFLYKFE